MPSPTVKAAVNKVDQSVEEDTKATANNPLQSTREKLRVETKRFAAGGIIQGVREIMSGDFSGIEEELAVTVEGIVEGIESPKFSGQAITPSSSTLFALKPVD